MTLRDRYWSVYVLKLGRRYILYCRIFQSSDNYTVGDLYVFTKELSASILKGRVMIIEYNTTFSYILVLSRESSYILVVSRAFYRGQQCIKLYFGGQQGIQLYFGGQ